ncbi:hypothetical protein Aperf_G00000063299 [Anoplocephala perfoliata]
MLSASLDPSIYALYVQINNKFQDVIPTNREKGIEQVIQGRFALLDESPMTDYCVKKYCLTASEPLWYGTYVFYMPKLLPYYDIINNAIISMESDGTIDQILMQGQKELMATLPNSCAATFKDQAIEAMQNPLVNWSDYSIEFSAAFGIFIISLIGLLLVLIVLLVEYCIGAYEKVPEGRHQ